MPAVKGRRRDPVMVVVMPSAYVRAWRQAGQPRLADIVRAGAAFDPPLSKSTIHAVHSHARGRATYSGRIGLDKARALASILGVPVGRVFVHGTGDPISG